MKAISVLLVDDHPIVRQGLAALLKFEDDIEVIRDAENGREAVALARELRPDVVLMDISMPLLNGIEATRQIRKTTPSTRVLVLSSYSDDELVDQMLGAGAAGYLNKQTATGDLAAAIRTVHSGKSYLSPALLKRWRRRHAGSVSDWEAPKTGAKLSSREMEVLQLVAEGYANKQIAAELNISTKTVEKHRQSLMTKLDTHETAGLTRYAISRGLVHCTPPGIGLTQIESAPGLSEQGSEP
jgi:DNA-binding NarL/FixJ family response regulator